MSVQAEHDNYQLPTAFGDLKIDRSTMCIHSHYGSVDLTAKEMRALEILALANGRFLAKPVLLKVLFGPDSEADVNVIDVYINYLRRKFMQAGSAVTIESASGLGYRICR